MIKFTNIEHFYSVIEITMIIIAITETEAESMFYALMVS